MDNDFLIKIIEELLLLIDKLKEEEETLVKINKELIQQVEMLKMMKQNKPSAKDRHEILEAIGRINYPDGAEELDD